MQLSSTPCLNNVHGFISALHNVNQNKVSANFSMHQDPKDFLDAIFELNAATDAQLQFTLTVKRECSACPHVSSVDEFMTHLPVDIANQTAPLNLEKLFASSISADTLDIRCTKCNADTAAIQLFSFSGTSAFVLVQIKRFYFDMDTRVAGKISTPITIPDGINISSEQLNSECGPCEDIGYETVAVIIHQGVSIHSGHYHAIRRISGGNWWHYDDDTVHKFGSLTEAMQYDVDSRTGCYLVLLKRCS